MPGVTEDNVASLFVERVQHYTIVCIRQRFVCNIAAVAGWHQLLRAVAPAVFFTQSYPAILFRSSYAAATDDSARDTKPPLLCGFESSWSTEIARTFNGF